MTELPAQQREWVRHNAIHRLGDGIPTLAEHLSAASYATAAFVGSPALGETAGLARGFEIYSRVDPEERKVSRVGGSTP